jgi:hypothetical protein
MYLNIKISVKLVIFLNGSLLAKNSTLQILDDKWSVQKNETE